MRSLTLRVLAVALVLIGIGAEPAAADAAGPSDFRSEVTGIEPAVDGVHAEIRGGDAFLELTVEEGVEVTVLDYAGDGKAYLRFLADGTVQRNRNATATYVNDDRKGGGEVPALASDPDAPEDWEDIADGGSYAWHDHRVHWMQKADPPVDRGERVGGEYDPWRVPLVVDGVEVTIQGTLTYEDTTSPLPWAAVALVAGGLLGWFGRRRAVSAAAAALVVASAAAAVVGRADFASTPDGGGNPLLWTLPLVALLLALVAFLRRTTGTAVVAALASVAALSGWALLRLGVFTKPVLPTDLSPSLDRAAVAAALGVCAAAAYLAVTSGALSLPALDDDEPS